MHCQYFTAIGLELGTWSVSLTVSVALEEPKSMRLDIIDNVVADRTTLLMTIVEQMYSDVLLHSRGINQRPRGIGI